jgi:phosphatidylglycerophosphate synthase
MTSLISRIFSDQYANHKAIGENTLLWIMYRLAYPFSFILYKLKFSPNKITTLSTIFALLAAIFLVMGYPEAWFLVFWSGSILLDFCDGTVARMSDNISKTSFDYDHLSDIFKIFIIMLSACIYYDSFLMWLISMSTSFLFMFYTLLNHELAYATKLLEIKKNKSKRQKIKEIIISRNGIFKFIKTLLPNKLIFKIARGFYVAFTTINGHTLLLFLAIPYSFEMTIISFVYFFTLSIFGVKNRIVALCKIPKKIL